jgi:hypothetical protein
MIEYFEYIYNNYDSFIEELSQYIDDSYEEYLSQYS